MENTVRVDHIAFTMDPGAILRRKLLVEEMALEGMAFNTPRAKSGAIVKPAPDKGRADSGGGIRVPFLKTPPVSEILAREELISAQRSQALQESAAALERDLVSARSDLPDKAEAAEYRRRLDKLLSGSDLSKARLDEAKALQKEIRAERDRVQNAEDRITENLSSLRARLKEAKDSVGEDVSRLKGKYALTPGGLANITRALFGDRAGAWADRGVQALKLLSYLPSGRDKDPEKVRPPRGKGVDIRLRDRIPLPQFWVKRAALSIKAPAGVIAGEAMDFSSDQSLLKRPASFDVSGKDLQGGAFLRAEGTLDHMDPAAPRDEFKVGYDGWRMTDLILSESENLPVILRQGSGTLAASVIMKGEALEGYVRLDLSSVALETGAVGDSTLARAIKSALQGVEKFSLAADVGGTLMDPEVQLSSDLDGILKEAVGQAAREEADRLETGLRNAVEERMAPALADAQKTLQRLESARTELQAVRTDLEEALKSKAGIKLPF
jgi:uncharacterized protein (TIGR03545 family)